MPLYELPMPPTFFTLSTFIFLIAIQLSSRARVLISPLLFGTAIISLCTSSYLPPHEGTNGLWALLNCVWILHASHTLFFDNLSIPHGAPPWTSAYKIWADPQGRMNWKAGSSKASSRVSAGKSKNRVSFASTRFFQALGCWLLQLCIFEPFMTLYISPTSDDFAPSRQVLFRRLLWPNAGPEFTQREIQIRLFTSVSWIWQGFLMLHTCHALLSIFFVTFLRIDTPEEWPPLFGNPMQAYSVRRFWTKFWHRMTVPGSISSGKIVARRVGVVPGSRLEKFFIACWTFLLSGIYHAIADWQAGESCIPSADLFFFMANFGAIAIETFAAPMITLVGKQHSNSILCQILFSDKGGKLIGFAWILGFFFWVVPKWQYSKMYLTLLKAEGALDASDWFTPLLAEADLNSTKIAELAI